MAAYSGKALDSLTANEGIPRLVEEMRRSLEQARPIKMHSNIDVYRAVWRDRDVVVKHYKHIGMVHSFRYTIKGSRAHRAWINGRRLLDLGIRTPQPLAYFDEHRGSLLWQSWLITEYMDRPTLYTVLHDQDIPKGRKRRLIHQVLRLIDRLGSHGINHGDTKHTNLLCDAGRIVLTDLDGMEIHSLPWLHRQRRGRDIARFLRDLDFTGPIPLTNPTQSTIRTESQDRLWLHPALQNTELGQALAAGPEAVVERFHAQPVQAGSASRVHRFTAVIDGASAGVYLKEYLDRSIWERLKRLVRPSRAMRDIRASQMLAIHGFRVPQILALGDTRSAPCDFNSPHPSNAKRRISPPFTATLEVAGALSLYNYRTCPPGTPLPCSLREKRDMIRQLGLIVGMMHRKGIVHGDLRPGNVLARRTDGCWEFFFLDNEHTRKPMRLSNHLRLKNLVQINMLPPSTSRTDRLRFFHSYLLVNPRIRLHRRWWAEEIVRCTDNRFQRKGLRPPSAT